MKTSLYKTIALSALASITLTGCLGNSDSHTTELPSNLQGSGDVVATIDGVNVYKSEFAAYVKARTGESYDTVDTNMRQRIFSEYKQLELLSREAMKRGVGDADEIAIMKRNLHKNLLTQALMENEDEASPITAAEIKAKYDSELDSLSPTLYKARHILVETEDAANAIIAELDKGADFIALAKEKSTGPSGVNGGDLGWFSADRMVAPFSRATAALENGKYSATPVQTQFGFHVILKEDQKREEAPSLESLEPRLKNQLRQERVTTFIKALEEKADIQEMFTEAKDMLQDSVPSEITETTESTETEAETK